ncbi:hypothetical protein ACWGIN_27720 [Streptomyces sp. NPDC054861]
MLLLTRPRPTKAGRLAALRRSLLIDATASAHMAGRQRAVVLYTTSMAARRVLAHYAHLRAWKVMEDEFFDRPGSGRGLAMACAAAESPAVDGILTVDRRMLPAGDDTYERLLWLLGRHSAFLGFVPPALARRA